MSATFPINHDLHCHTSLSLCCREADFTPQVVYEHAKNHGYSAVCITNHFWDANIPGANDYYSAQNLEHIKQALPLPHDDKLRVMFGCEAEYRGGKNLGVTPEIYDEFDIIVIPVNHFHQKFVFPGVFQSPEEINELFLTRFEELLELDLPWQKIGLAHLNSTKHLKEFPYTMTQLNEDRLREVFRRVSEYGAGVELNAAFFSEVWQENGSLRLFQIAKEENCKFYCASDAHTRDGLKRISERLGKAAEMLGLTADDLFMPVSCHYN